MSNIEKTKYNWSIVDIQKDENKAIISVKFENSSETFYHPFLLNFYNEITFDMIQDVVKQYLLEHTGNRKSLSIIEQMIEEKAVNEIEIIHTKQDKIMYDK